MKLSMGVVKVTQLLRPNEYYNLYYALTLQVTSFHDVTSKFGYIFLCVL